MKPQFLFVMVISAVLVVLLGSRVIGVFTSQSPSWKPQPPIASASMFVAELPKAPAFELPTDSGYVNVKAIGAKGDGRTDDTDVLKKVLGRNKEDPGGAIRSIYFPNGTYLVSDTLEWGDKRKDVRGQSRDGVVIKLKDHCPGFQDRNKPKKVLQIEFGHGGQNFNQRLHNLTVDVGKENPGAIGIGFHTNNGGGVYDVVIRSSDPQKRGHTGLSLDKPWPGPGLVKKVYVDGFDTGIFITHDQYSMTFEHILLTNQRQVGFVNSWNTVAIRDLKSMNRVPAVENRGQMGVMALVEAELTGGSANSPAIVNHSEGVLFARNLQTQGYSVAIDNQAGQVQQVSGPRVLEFVSHRVSSLFSDAQKSLSLAIEEPPDIPYGDPKKWVSVTHFGARSNDGEEDGVAIQKAINSGAQTIYFPAGSYHTQHSIRVHGNVQRLVGLNASLTLTVTNQPAFIIEDGRPQAIAIELESSYDSQHNYWIQHASKRTLLMRGGSYINTIPGGKVFIEDTAAVPLIFDHQKVWMRQINTESYAHNPHIVNNGGDLWILGLKTEKDRTIIGTYAGGRTEVLGGLLYKNREQIGPSPAFICEDGEMSLVYRNKGEAYQTQILEKRNGNVKEFQVQEMPASNWRMPLYVSHRKSVP